MPTATVVLWNPEDVIHAATSIYCGENVPDPAAMRLNDKNSASIADFLRSRGISAQAFAETFPCYLTMADPEAKPSWDEPNIHCALPVSREGMHAFGRLIGMPVVVFIYRDGEHPPKEVWRS